MNSLQDGTIEIRLANREVFLRGEQIIIEHPVENIFELINTTNV